MYIVIIFSLARLYFGMLVCIINDMIMLYYCEILVSINIVPIVILVYVDLQLLISLVIIIII